MTESSKLQFKLIETVIRTSPVTAVRDLKALRHWARTLHHMDVVQKTLELERFCYALMEEKDEERRVARECATEFPSFANSEWLGRILQRDALWEEAIDIYRHAMQFIQFDTRYSAHNIDRCRQHLPPENPDPPLPRSADAQIQAAIDYAFALNTMKLHNDALQVLDEAILQYGEVDALIASRQRLSD